MATFTITTPQNIDELTSKAGGDIYNINGGILTVDQDSRYGLNQTTSSSLGAITISATLGGILNIDGRYVRLIPYDTGTGNVPASNTVISIGGASGKLIGVWSALTSAPTAVGAAMPASGFIKIKQWNSVAYSAGALTGIGASATGVDVAGWLDIIGDEAGTLTIPRLGQWNITGDWYLLGSTTGANSGTYQLPTSGLTTYCPGVFVETSPSSGTYEFYANAGTATALPATFSTDFRSKVCWVSTAGVVRFQHDGTNSTGGYLPASGCAIRVGNVFLQNCTTAARTANVLPNATIATRYETATTGGAVINLDKASCGWYLNMSQPYSVALSNIGVFDNINASEVATPMTWSFVGVGQSAAVLTFGLSMSLNFAGGTLTDCVFTSRSLAASGRYIVSLADLDGFTFTRIKVFQFTPARGNATTGAIILTRVANTTFNNTILGCGRALITTCTNLFFNDTTYFDNGATNTISTNPMYAFDLASSCNNVRITGVDFGGLYMCQPYNGILQLGAAGCIGTKLRNIGTYASPLSLGKPRVDDMAWTRVTTTATVTDNAHGFAVNDTIYVVVSSNTGAIVVGAKTITAVTTNTFSFVCLNAGAASGTVSYFGTKCANVFICGTGASTNDLKVQRVYGQHTRTNLYTVDNSSKNITLENVFSDYLTAPLFSGLNMFARNVSGTPPMTAQTAVYGTHWFNGYVCDVADNLTGLAWSRSGTTVTVTSAGHSLRTGMVIVVSNTSDSAAIRNGFYSATALTSSTFNITGINAGATSGTLNMRVGNGRIGLVMNEPTAETAELISYDAGTPKFTSAGGLYMPTIGDQVTFTQAEYVIGQGSSFPIMEGIMAGSTLTRYTIQYSLDKNDDNGFGAFHNLYYERSGANGVNGASTIDVTDATGVEIDDYVWGTNVGPLAKVTGIASNTLTVDVPNIGTVSGILRFNHLPSETALGPETGIKMKWRFTTVTTNTAAITSFYILAESTVVGRAYQYPLSRPYVTAQDIQTGSVFSIYDDSTGDFLGTGTENGGDVSAQVPWSADYTAKARLRKAGWQPVELSPTILEDDIAFPVTQTDYATIADTDPGALGITVTNHGASPVTWNAKDFSITITTTNDSLTASQIANYINYNISQNVNFNGFKGTNWPEMVLPDGTDFQTSRGNLLTSAGTTLKGVRVVRNDGTTPVPGFTRFQADDGTYYTPPVSITVALSGLRAGSRVQIFDTTNTVEKFNAVVGGTSMSYSETYTSDYDVRVRVMYATAVTADKFIEFTDAVSTNGLSRSVVPEVDPVYVANAVDGFSVTGITIDDAALLIEADDGTYSWASIYAYETAWLFSEEGIRDEGRFITAIDTANYLLENFKIKNISSPSAPLILTNGWGRDVVTNQTITIIDTTGGSIFSNPDLVVSYATGSGLSPSEQATLAKIDTLTEDSGGLRFTTKALETAGGSSLTVGAIADAVWDEVLSGHTTPGSAGDALDSAGSGGYDDTILIGKVDVIDANVDAIKAKTDTLVNTDLTGIATSVQVSGVQSVVDAIPTLLEIEASTILAKEATASSRASQASVDGKPNLVAIESSTVLAKTSDITSAQSVIIGEVNANETKIDTLQTSVNSKPSLANIEASIILAKEATVATKASQSSVDSIPTNPLLTSDTRLNNLDATISSRLASASYTAPANSDISAIKAKTDTLPSDPADQSLIIDATNSLASQISALPAPLDASATQSAVTASLNAYDPPTKAEMDSAISGIPSVDYSAIATAVWANVTRSLTADVTLGTSEITEIATAIQAAIINEGDGQMVIDAIVQAIGNINLPAATIALAVRTELTTELARINVNLDSRASQSSMDTKPSLANIEASTVLAKEATLDTKASQDSVYGLY
jgi:hypothetical protein